MLIPKLVLFAAICILQGLETQDSAPSTNLPDQQTAQPTQHSILVRTGEKQTGDQSTDLVTRVAKLPLTSSEPVRTSLSQLPGQQRPNPAQTSTQQFVLQITGADLIESGRLQTFKIKLKNQGTANSDLMEIRLGIPPGYQFQDSDVRAQFDSKRNVAAWQLESLQPNVEKEIHFRAVAIGQGPQLHQIKLIQNQTIQQVQQLETFIMTSKSRNATDSNQTASQTGPPIVESEPLPHKTRKY